MDGESHNQHDLWGQFRFAVIGGLLTHPPEQGGLQEELHKLSELTYRHPLTGAQVVFGFSTIERWYYQALRAERPVAALGRKIRSDAHALWHLDFHHGRLRVLDSRGSWHTPSALCILDDHSRLCCHIQWYLQETAQILQHGLTQTFHKRGLPRALMSDNGSAMIAGETRNGLLYLGLQHDKTLPYSPYQNGKQEAFWRTLEGRLVAMLTQTELITLERLNYITQA